MGNPIERSNPPSEAQVLPPSAADEEVLESREGEGEVCLPEDPRPDFQRIVPKTSRIVAPAVLVSTVPHLIDPELVESRVDPKSPEGIEISKRRLLAGLRSDDPSLVGLAQEDLEKAGLLLACYDPTYEENKPLILAQTLSKDPEVNAAGWESVGASPDLVAEATVLYGTYTAYLARQGEEGQQELQALAKATAHTEMKRWAVAALNGTVPPERRGDEVFEAVVRPKEKDRPFASVSKGRYLGGTGRPPDPLVSRGRHSGGTGRSPAPLVSRGRYSGGTERPLDPSPIGVREIKIDHDATGATPDGPQASIPFPIRLTLEEIHFSNFLLDRVESLVPGSRPAVLGAIRELERVARERVVSSIPLREDSPHLVLEIKVVPAEGGNPQAIHVCLQKGRGIVPQRGEIPLDSPDRPEEMNPLAVVVIPIVPMGPPPVERSTPTLASSPRGEGGPEARRVVEPAPKDGSQRHGSEDSSDKRRRQGSREPEPEDDEEEPA